VIFQHLSKSVGQRILMDREILKALAKDPKYIPGIYNYCDRWCERCALSSRCLNRALVEEHFGDLQESDALNEAFWQRLSEMLNHTLSLLRETAKERGIDLDRMDHDRNGQSENMIKESAVGHLIFHASEGYARAVEEWFQANEYLFYRKEEELNQIRLVSARNDPASEAIGINDAIEVIRWYQYQIAVKLMRAIGSAAGEKDSELRDFPKDSDGSAKVALISIERSISAWTILLSSFPEQKKQIVGFMASLENIKNRVETQFPQARAFMRPGFDEMPDGG